MVDVLEWIQEEIQTNGEEFEVEFLFNISIF